MQSGTKTSGMLEDLQRAMLIIVETNRHLIKALDNWGASGKRGLVCTERAKYYDLADLEITQAIAHLENAIGCPRILVKKRDR